MTRLALLTLTAATFFLTGCLGGGGGSSSGGGTTGGTVTPPKATTDLFVKKVAPSGSIPVANIIHVIEIQLSKPLDPYTLIYGSTPQANTVRLRNKANGEDINIVDVDLLENDTVLAVHLADTLDIGVYTLTLNRSLEAADNSRFAYDFSHEIEVTPGRYTAWLSGAAARVNKAKTSLTSPSGADIHLAMSNDFKISYLDQSYLQISRGSQAVDNNDFDVRKSDHLLIVSPKNGAFDFIDGGENKLKLTLKRGLFVDLSEQLNPQESVSVEITEKRTVKPENEVPLAVFLMSFSNIEFTGAVDYWSKLTFGQSDSNLNDFYYLNSHGKHLFKPVSETSGTYNDGIIEVSLDVEHPWNDKADLRNEALRLTLQQAHQNYGLDFSKYDKNNNGNIEPSELALVFVYAGGALSAGDPEENSVHPHAHCTSSGFNIGGTRVTRCPGQGQAFSIVSETRTGQPCTVGVIAHELGHSWLGLADYYDYTYTTRGTGVFSLMSFGSSFTRSHQTDGGDYPIGLDAYSKIAAGFHINNPNLELIENPSSDAYYSLPESGLLKSKIMKAGGNSQFFVFEHRGRSNYDYGLGKFFGSSYDGGLLIWHIDESVEKNDNVNHRRVDVEEAGISRMDKSDRERLDTFWGPHSDNYDFGPQWRYGNALSNSDYYNGTASNIILNEISGVDPSTKEISFYFSR